MTDNNAQIPFSVKSNHRNKLIYTNINTTQKNLLNTVLLNTNIKYYYILYFLTPCNDSTHIRKNYTRKRKQLEPNV